MWALQGGGGGASPQGGGGKKPRGEEKGIHVNGPKKKTCKKFRGKFCGLGRGGPSFAARTSSSNGIHFVRIKEKKWTVA